MSGLSNSTQSPADASLGPSDAEGTITEAEKTANSLQCDDCTKLFRNVDYAQIHAHKSGHTNFSESTDTLKPLTDEEKAEKLVQLQQRMEERREQRRLQEIADRKESERIRRKAGKELIEAQERLKEKEMVDAVEAKKRDKAQELKHKARVLAEIERDKQDRLARQNRNKLVANPTPPPAAAPRTPSNANTARLQIRGAAATPLVHEFPADSVLQDVFAWLMSQGVPPGQLTTPFPRRVFSGAESAKTLRELDLVPSAALNFMKS